MSMEEDAYLLGTGNDEITRLKLQHDIWLEQTERTLDLADFGEGERILDLGAGPGFTSLAIAQRVSAKGRVTAVDLSPRFANHLTKEAQKAGLENIDFQEVDVHRMALPEAPYDGALARWLFCFLADPESAIRAVADHLRPGARFAIYDYINYLTMSFHPDHPSLAKFFQAVHRCFADSGGSLDICDRLPFLLSRNGFTVKTIEQFCEVSLPGGKYWRWFKAFRANFAQTLLDGDYLSIDQLNRFDQLVADRE